MSYRSRNAHAMTVSVVVILLLLGSDVVGQQADSAAADLAITDVNVVDVLKGRVLAGRTILIRDGVIDGIEPASHVRSSAARVTIDGDGGYLIPGLLDMHAHIRGNGMPEWITTDWFMPLLLANGVTGIRDMNSACDDPSQGPVCLPEMRAMAERVEAGDLLGPRLLALSSWMVNPPWDYDLTEEEARQVVGMFHEQGVDLIKVYFRLSPEGLGWIADEASTVGLATAGHIPLRMTAAEASDAGLRSLEHARDFLFDCFPGSGEFRASATSQNPPVELMRAMVDQHDPTVCAEAFRTMVRNDTWYVPTHVTRRMEAMAGDSAFRNDPRNRYVFPPLLDDWNRDADGVVARDSSVAGRDTYMDFYRKGLEITGAAHGAGVRILAGSDGGDSFVFPGSGLHDELVELVAAGLSPAEALRAATSDGAEFLGLGERYGSVEVGKRADLVLLADNPLEDIENVRGIQAVIFRGEALDRERLDALLRQAEEAAARPL